MVSPSVGLPRVVATIFYNPSKPRETVPSQPKSPRSPRDAIPALSPPTLATLSSGAVPTENLDSYPMEPPTDGAGIDPSNNLYGDYVSQTCLADFIRRLGEEVPHFDSDSVRIRDLDEHAAKSLVKEVEFGVPADFAVDRAGLVALRCTDTLDRWEREWSVEVVLQRASVFRRHKRLAVFDMDSTLIQQEVIDEIAAELGVKPQVAAITEAAMNGRLDFEQSLRQRCALLAGVPSSVWDTLKRERITLTPGAADFVRALKRLGFKSAVLSGGFMPLATWLAGELGLDYAHANNLVVSAADGGKTLTGELEGAIVHAERKRELVQQIAKAEGIPLDQVLVVGDGANDLPMMSIAGLGMALNAKTNVQMQAPNRLNRTTMRDLLFCLGLTRAEQEELLA
jgi:phosphoserine phosphatase